MNSSSTGDNSNNINSKGKKSINKISFVSTKYVTNKCVIQWFKIFHKEEF